jgi:hypothetical protein
VVSLNELFKTKSSIELGEVIRLCSGQIYEITVNGHTQKAYNATQTTIKPGTKVILNSVGNKRFIVNTTRKTKEHIKEVYRNG